MKIKITNFRGYNPDAFANLTTGSIHEAIKETDDGWIVRGSNGENVLVLFNEAEEVTI